MLSAKLVTRPVIVMLIFWNFPTIRNLILHGLYASHFLYVMLVMLEYSRDIFSSCKQNHFIIMFHGTQDYLLDVDDPNVTPMTGNLYPIKFAESSRLHAESLGIANPFVHHLIFDQAAHSFDTSIIAAFPNWNTVFENADEKSKRLARDETLKWFEFRLKSHQPTAQNVSGTVKIIWEGYENISYQIRRSTSLTSWLDEGAALIGTGSTIQHDADLSPSGRAFYVLKYSPTEPPVAEAVNAGFFRPYSEFTY